MSAVSPLYFHSRLSFRPEYKVPHFLSPHFHSWKEIPCIILLKVHSELCVLTLWLLSADCQPNVNLNVQTIAIPLPCQINHICIHLQRWASLFYSHGPIVQKANSPVKMEWQCELWRCPPARDLSQTCYKLLVHCLCSKFTPAKLPAILTTTRRPNAMCRAQPRAWEHHQL